MAEGDSTVAVPHPRPGLLQPLGAPFRGSAWQRWLARSALRLLGIPGVALLLVKIHARRTRQRF